jgi:stearoyl-CoA desaturase (delta-9 desaturase)
VSQTLRAVSHDSKDQYSLSSAPFAIFHLATFIGLFFVEFQWSLVALCIALYYARMFAITAGFHRYFAHRAYKTGRVFQFFLAVLGTMSIQKGVLWWAAHHRDHHKYSDLENDIHSPRQRGFLYSHMGWILSERYNETKFDRIRDFAKYPELIWLNKHHTLVAVIFGVVMFAIGGLPYLVWGFGVSTVLLWHGTFTINSLSHVFGTTRYKTGDDSKNSLILALITMGEGWHNNHHYYQSSANQGFFWWEIDLSYYLLKALAVVGVVWDLRKPTEKALRGELKPSINPTPELAKGEKQSSLQHAA